MLEIKPGRLYKTIRSANGVVFNEKHRIIKYVRVPEDSVLLAVSKPYGRPRLASDPPLSKQWCCKYLFEEQVIELVFLRGNKLAGYQEIMKEFIVPLEKPSDA